MSRKVKLNRLFDKMIDEMQDRLDNGEGTTEDGAKIKASAATLNTVRQFLKDQGIGADQEHSDPVKRLTTSLPFTKVDEYGLNS